MPRLIHSCTHVHGYAILLDALHIYYAVCGLGLKPASHTCIMCLQEMEREFMKVRLLAGWTYDRSTTHVNGPMIHARMPSEALEFGM